MSIICEAPDIIEEIYNNQKKRIDQLVEAFENLFKTIAVPDLKYPFIPLDYSWFIQTILKFLAKFNLRLGCELGLALAVELRRYRTIKTNEIYIENYEKSPDNISSQRQVQFGEFYEDKFNEAVQFLKDKQCVGDVPFGLLSGLCSQLINGLITYIEQNIDNLITEFKKALFLNEASKAFADITGLIQTIFSIADASITDIQKLVDIYDCIYLTQKTLTLTESNFKEFQKAIEENPTKQRQLPQELLKYHESTELNKLRQILIDIRSKIPSTLQILSAISDLINEGREIWYKHLDALRNVCQVQYQKENISPVIRNSLFTTGGYNNSGSTAPQIIANKKPSFNASTIIQDTVIVNTVYTNSIIEYASDPNITDVLSFSKIKGPSWLSVSNQGIITGKPSLLNIGLNKWIVQVIDSSGFFSQAKLIISVLDTNNSGGNQIALDSDFTDELRQQPGSGLSETTFQKTSSNITVQISLNKNYDISYEDSKNSKMVTYNLMHIPILLFNLMKVYNINDEPICLSDLITNINLVNFDKLINQLLINSPNEDPDSDLVFREAIQSVILPFLIDYSSPTVGQILNVHTTSTINIISDIIEHYYFFGAVKLDELLGFTYESEDTIIGELKNKLLLFKYVINEFDGLCVFGEDDQLETLFINYFGSSRIDLLLQILNLLTCDQLNITYDKYRLISINKILNILQNNNSQISSTVINKFEYLRDNILNINDLSLLNAWITIFKNNLLSLGPFIPVDNQTIINIQSNITIGTLKFITGSNYQGSLGNNIYIKVRLDDSLLKPVVIKEDVLNKIVTLFIGSNITSTIDETDVSDAILFYNIQLIDIDGIGNVTISNIGNYKTSGGINLSPPIMCGLSQNIINNDTFLYYLIDYINDAGCSLHPDTLDYEYPIEDMTLAFCLSGLDAKYRSIHDYQLQIIKLSQSEKIIDGVLYQARTPGSDGNLIYIEIIDQIGPIEISISEKNISIKCDLSLTKQTDIRDAINNNTKTFDLVIASGGSLTTNATTQSSFLEGGLDAEYVYNYQEYLNLTNQQITSTLITDNKNILLITDDNEFQLGFIDISTDNKFPLQESGFKIFLPEGCSGLYMRLYVNEYQDAPYIIGKYRYAPTRYEIDNYSEYIKDISFQILKDREVFVRSGESNYITVISSKGLPLTTSGWLYIYPINCSIDNIEIQILYHNEYYVAPNILDDEPIQIETKYVRYDWFGETCYTFGGITIDGNISDIVHKLSLSNPSTSVLSGQIQLARYSSSSVANNENILIIGGSDGLTELSNIELFKGSSETSFSFSELSYTITDLATASNGEKYIIAGGISSGFQIDNIKLGFFNTVTDIVDYGSLNSVRSHYSGCSNGIAAIFSGGYSDTITTMIFRDDIELTDDLSGLGIGYEEINTGINIIETFYINIISEIQDFGDLLFRRYNHTSACNSTKILFAGGIGDYGILDSIEILNPAISAITSNYPVLISPRYNAISCNNSVDFVTIGGINDSGLATSIIETTKFEIPVQSSEFGQLTEAKSSLTSSSIG